MACLKVLFCCVTILYTLSAIALATGGVLYSVKVKEYTDLRNKVKHQFDDSLTWPQLMPYVFAAVGTFVFLTSLCGMCGTVFSSKSLLITHAMFLFLALCLLIGTGVTTMFIAGPKNDEFIHETVTSVFKEIKYNDHVFEAFGRLEQFLSCCGLEDYQDYIRDKHFRRVIPQTCCDDSSICKSDLQKERNSRRGCVEVAAKYSYRAFLYGSIVCGVAGCFGALGLIANIVVIVMGRRKSKTIS